MHHPSTMKALATLVTAALPLIVIAPSTPARAATASPTAASAALELSPIAAITTVQQSVAPQAASPMARYRPYWYNYSFWPLAIHKMVPEEPDMNNWPMVFGQRNSADRTKKLRRIFVSSPWELDGYGVDGGVGILRNGLHEELDRFTQYRFQKSSPRDGVRYIFNVSPALKTSDAWQVSVTLGLSYTRGMFQAHTVAYKLINNHMGSGYFAGDWTAPRKGGGSWSSPTTVKAQLAAMAAQSDARAKLANPKMKIISWEAMQKLAAKSGVTLIPANSQIG